MTLYMTNTQVIRWLQNEDTSTISFKRFNLSPNDMYPSISICFTGHELYWYNDDLIFQRFGVTTATYQNMLKGEEGYAYDYNYTSKLYTKFQIENKDLLVNDIEKFHIDVSNIVTGLVYTTRDESTSIRYAKGKRGKPVNQIPLSVSYMTADTMCFTRTSNDPLDTLRVHDWLMFNRSILGNGKYGNVEFQILLHHPQQLLRSFHRPIFKSKVGYMANINDENKKPWTKLLRIAISKVTVLKKRPQSNVPCDQELTNDDEKLQKTIMKHIQCIPIYWKYNVGLNLNIKVCNTSQDLRKAHYFIKNYKTVFGAYDPPCVSSEIWGRFDKEEDNESDDPWVQFLYRESVYQEIANTQSFNSESFVSGVGGFVGIFLGYSILQLPDLLSLIPALFQKFKNVCNNRKV